MSTTWSSRKGDRTSCPSASTSRDRSGPRDARGPAVHSATSRAIAPEKGLHLCRAYRVLRREQGVPPSRVLEVAGYLAPETGEYLRRIAARRSAKAGFAGVAVSTARSIARRKIEFLRGLDVFSVTEALHRAEGTVSARSDGVRRAGRAAAARRVSWRCIGRTGGGLLVDPGRARASRKDSCAVESDPGAPRRARPARLRRRARSTTAVARMAERVLTVVRGRARAASRRCA